MRRPYVGFYAEPSDGAALHFRRVKKGGQWRVHYSPSPDALARAKQLDKDFSAPKTRLLLLEGDSEEDRLTMHPLTLDANSPNFLKPRHAPITTITLVGFRLGDAETLAAAESEIERLPVGFVRSAYRGLGLNYDLRLMVDTIGKIPGVADLRIEKRSAAGPAIRKGSFSLPYSLFETSRKDIGRVHDKALAAARTEKASRLHDKLLNPVDPVVYPIIGQPYHPDAVVKAVGDGLKQGLALSPADASLLVEAATGLVGQVARSRPTELLKLTEAVETVTLEAMVKHMRSRINESHGEDNWQTFLSQNAFILRLAFGVPVLLFQEQATVGGRSYNGIGDKKTDFLLQAAKTGNLAIVEIKTPQTELLEAKHYRVGIHAPHRELAGAVNQVLDQRWHLQRHNVALAEDLRRQGGPRPDDTERVTPETYAVQCLVIAGTTPKDLNLQKSFELYRNGLNGVVVLTYDELLQKLVHLLRLLKDPDANSFRTPTVTVKEPKRRRRGLGPGRTRPRRA